jgi:putative phosphatase
MNTGKTIVAFVYDFDHTLCTTDMQNYSFIPSLNIKTGEFWSAANDLSVKENMDPLLAYMYLMIEESKKRNLPINREAFVQLGKDIQYFPGVEGWFKRLDEYGASRGVEVQHYVISSGNKEIIEGSSIAPYFREVFACEFLYKDGAAVWPKSAVNYTTKTQFLYRINKGVLELYENNKVNASMPDEDKPVPMQNMVYIADGETDVPCMKTVRANGGFAIAVYDKKKKKPAASLFRDRRVDFLCEADYSEESKLDEIAKLIIDKVAPMDKLYRLHYQQVDEEEGRKK